MLAITLLAIEGTCAESNLQVFDGKEKSRSDVVED